MAEFKFDEKTRQNLRGLMPFSQEGVIDFTPSHFFKAGLPKELITIFSHRCFTQAENTQYLKLIEGDKLTANEQREGARRVVKGWRNLYDLATGREIEFKADASGVCEKELWDTVILDFAACAIFQNAGRYSGLFLPEVQGLKS